MADTNSRVTAPSKDETKKDRKPARTIAEQIAALQAKGEVAAKRTATRTTKKLDTVLDDIVKAEGKLLALLKERDELRAKLGQDEDSVDTTDTTVAG